MILSQNTNLISPMFRKCERNDCHNSTPFDPIHVAVGLKGSGSIDGKKNHCSIDTRDEEDDYRLLTSTRTTEVTENSAYTQSLCSSLRDLEDEYIGRSGHYFSNSSCIESDTYENSFNNDASQSFCINNWPQEIDRKLTLKRANPVCDLDSDSEFEQEENQRKSKRSKSLDFLSTELYLEDNCFRNGNCTPVYVKDP